MLEASPWMNVRAPTFVRLLARLGDAGPPQREPSLSDQLSQWIDWTRAIALSRVLDAGAQAMASTAPALAARDGEDCMLARAGLTRMIMEGGDVPKPVHPGAAAVDTADFTPWRQHCTQVQRTMLATTGQLRGRLRDRLAQRSPQMARLAEIDAVMEMTLSPREHALLARVPDALERHFDRVRPASQIDTAAAQPEQAVQTELAVDEPSPSPPSPPSNWQLTFRRDMQGVLLAELDVRFQPIEGLLAALQTE